MKNRTMNQMNQMNLSRGLKYIKKYFFDLRVCTASILGSFRFIGRFFGSLTLFSINILLNISTLDVSNECG